MERAELFEAVADIVARRALIPREALAGPLRLYHDLGISGDDARDALEDISSRFGVMFDGAWVDARFPTEGQEGSLSFWLHRRLRRLPPIPPITLDGLVDHVTARRKGMKE